MRLIRCDFSVKRALCRCALAVCLLAFTAVAQAQNGARAQSGRLLAKPKMTAPQADVTASEIALGTVVKRSFQRLGNLRVLEIKDGENAASKIAKLKRTGLFEFVEPDYIVTVHATPNDPKYLDGSSWGLHNTGQEAGVADADIDAPEGWDLRSAASAVVVAIVDTGARLTHEDLTGNLWSNPGEVAGDGLDNDGNGYIDDLHGINAITGGGAPDDDQGHGSHVAGILGAVGNNGVGLAGVAWAVRLMPLKFLGAQGSGATSDAIECINYAVTKGAHIISNSWGGGGDSQALREAIAAARSAGIAFVVSAGNDGMNNDEVIDYPSSYLADNLVTVASTTRTDSLSLSSNFGFGFVNFAAPGTDVVSTWFTSDSAYAPLSGTSMAVPQVSGALALLKAHFPSDNCAQLINRLERSVDLLPALTEKCRTGGRINLRKALASTRNTPFNDDFSESSAFTTSTAHLRAQNNFATAQPGEPAHAGQPGGGSIWWTWTPSSSGAVVVSTARSTFDTLLGVYTGASVGALTQIASDDNDLSGSAAARVRFNALAGTPYRIAVDGKSGARGSIVLSLGPPPANDAFSDALTLSGASASAKGTTALASREVGEPTHAGVAGTASIWWKWTAPVSGVFAVDSLGSDFDTLLAVYTGAAVAALSPVASNDDVTSSRKTSRVLFNAVAGTTYHFAVDGKSGAFGAVSLAIAQPPPNDAFANRVTQTGATFFTIGSNVGASTETGEPQHTTAEGGRSAWWTWTAPATGTFGIDTIGSSFDTLLAVYIGPGIGALEPLASDDDSGGDVASALQINAVAGETYQIAVDGFAGASGAITLRLEPVEPPPNDAFADRIALAGTPVLATGSSRYATSEPDEPSHFDNIGGASAWWSWQAPASGAFQIDTGGSDFDTVLAVYTGSTIENLLTIAEDDDSLDGLASRVIFNAVAGTIYQLVVDGFNGVSGAITLNIAAAQPTVTVAADQPNAAETGPVAGAFTLTRTGGTAAALTVNYAIAGTASGGGDYSALSGTAQIPAGSTTVSIPVEPIADNLAEGLESVILTISPNPAYTIGPANGATVAIADRPIDAWRFTYFGGNPAKSGDLEDFENDGISNLLEYALGLNPVLFDAAGLPAAGVEVAGSLRYLTLTFAKNTALTDVTFQAQTSSDGLASWQPLSDALIGPPGGVEMRQAKVLINGAGKALRLRITRP